MAKFEVDVGNATYEVDAPDEQTAWNWANLAHKKELSQKPAKDISLGERFKDVGAGVVSGVGALAQLPGQLSGLAGLTELDDTGLQGVGKNIQQYGQEMKSAGLKAREQERTAKIREAEKTGQLSAATTAFSETIKDPALLLNFLAEQAPQLVVPFGAAKGAAALTGAKALGKGLAAEEAALAAGRAGTRAAIGTGAVQQGADIGAGAYESVYKELISQGISEPDAKESALNLARATGASGAIISLLAQRLPGAKSMEEAFAGVPGTGGRLAGAVTAGLGESLGEVAEETGGRFSQNLAMRDVKPEQSLTEGLGETAGMAAVGGVGMGGISGALQRQRQEQGIAEPKTLEQHKKMLALGMNQPFTPVSLPDGSVAMTQEDLDNYERMQFEGKYAPQPADEKPTLALGMAQPFNPVSLPDGSVALTKADLDAYEQEQFEKQYAPQPNLNTVQPAATPPQLGYSPLPGVPKIAADGTVLLNEEQEFQARVAPQKTRITTEAWQAMSPEQQEKAVLDAQMATAPESIPETRPAKLTKEQQKPIYSPEELADVKDAKEALKDVNAGIAKAKSEGTDLFTRLKGVLPADEVHNILPEDKKGRVGTLASKSTGTPLSNLVADGSLNEFLPPDMRIMEPGQDEMPGVEYITQAIQNGDTRSFDSKIALQTLEKQKEELKSRVEQPKVERETNLQLGQAAEEQAGIEGLSTDALVEYAQTLGIDTEGIAQDVSRQTENMTADQYLGAVRNAIVSEVNSKTGMETLASAEKGEAGTNATKEELQMQKDLEGKTLIQAAQYAVDKAPDNFRKFVAQKVLNVLKSMQAAGVNFNFEVQGGKSRSSDLYDARGLATFVYGQNGNATSVVVLLNGTPALKNQLGYPSGMNYTTLLHELLHVATRMKVNFLDKSSPEVKALNDLYKTVVSEFNRQAKRKMLPPVLEKYYKRMNNALANADELMTWGMTDVDMQSWLSQIKVGEKTLMDKFVELARKILGISKPFETAFDRLVRTTDSILDIDVKTLANGMESYKYSLGPAKSKGKASPQQQSLFSKRAQELFGEKAGVETTKLGFGKKEKAPTPTAAGKEALSILDSIGRGEQPADPTYRARIEAGWNNAVDNPKATIEHFKKFGSRKISEFKTKTFSSDAALQDAYEEAIGNSYNNQEEVIGLLLQASTSQANHADGVAGVALEMGTVEFDEKNQKWKGKETADRFAALSDVLQNIAQKYGYTQEQMNRIYHTALETRQTEQMAEEDKIIHLNDAQLAAGREFFRINPELNDAVKVWNGIRKNIMKVMVEGGMYSQADADFLLSNTAYVPMYREMDPDSAGGPVDSMRGLRAAADKARKGSMRPVNDIFDNQVRWVEFAVSRAVKAHKARTLADAAANEGLAEKFNSKVVPPSTMPNVVKIWRNGKEEHFSMADPLFMDAFMGLQSVSIPMFKIAAKFANFLRQSIVMYPLFSAAQVTQDSVAAIFTSGLKPQFALRIPAYAVKELIRTMQGKSRYHDELKKYAAVGVRDVNSTVVRMEAEERFGIKGPPTLKKAIMQKLNSFAMAADNAVRQATYQAAMEAGLGQREAIEKSFEIFNVRRRGTSKALAFAGQVIPFFPAYLAAQNVAFRTLSGQGTSPSQRQEALKNLAATTASVMVLSMLYAMMNGDDEDYLKKPAVQRDRLLMIPGTGGLSVPLRADVFLFPKILAEHTYLMLTDKGYEDGRKFRDSMTSALSSAMTSPTVVPQVVKPAAEVLLNYNFFQQRPLIGTFQQKLETERQFTDSTSEFSKMLGQTGLIAPINADHLIRGMFGSFGGLALWMTNDLIASVNPSGERSDISLQDAIATMPGTSGFVSKSYESALKKDFYTLKEDVDRAVNTMNDLKKNAPQEIGGFLAKEENMARLGISKSVNAIGEKLSNIRAAMKQIQNSSMSGEEKERQIKLLRNAEEQMLQGVDVKKLRELGKI